MIQTVIPALIAFASAYWLGLYLIQRDPRQRRLTFAGMGLVAYAAALAFDTLNALQPDAISRALVVALTWLPAVCWAAALWTMRADPPRHVWGRRALSVLLISLSVGVVLLPFDPLPTLWIYVIGFDLFLLGVVIAALDALDAGEALLPDMFRSLLSAELAGWLFGSLVVIAMSALGVSAGMTALAFGVVALAIGLAIFGGALQTLIDRVTLATTLQRQERADLRAAAAAIPRQQPAPDLAALDEMEFARLTRRALSHMNDLPRLAASPLIGMSAISARVIGRGDTHGDTLARAAELKRLLTACIVRLKPDGGDFGTTNAWRHYNALYFPYVIGLRPYSQSPHDDLDPTARAALAWLRATVPERTLHNWQTAAARLVAQHLREIEGMTAFDSPLAAVGSENHAVGSALEQ
jgi:hypothetical protein